MCTGDNRDSLVPCRDNLGGDVSIVVIVLVVLVLELVGLVGLVVGLVVV